MFEFTTISAVRMRQQGLAEEARYVGPAPSVGPCDVRLTAAGAADWRFLFAARLIGASPQLCDLLLEGLAILQSGHIPERDLVRLDGDGAIFSQRGLRWVIRREAARPVIWIHGIAQARLDPFRKIWRYFDHAKAVDLLESGKLYFRRVDCLVDEYEARPTRSMVTEYVNALTAALGLASPEHLQFHENVRRSLFVSCWQKSETESPDMWTTYCPTGGGIAIQSTERQLQHQFMAMAEGRPQFFLRDIIYVDHATYNPRSHGVPEQAFLKRTRFVDEKEIRFAWWQASCVCGTQPEIENALRALPDHRRVPFDLTASAESIIMNPAASAEKRTQLEDLVQRMRPVLVPRIRQSAC